MSQPQPGTGALVGYHEKPLSAAKMETTLQAMRARPLAAARLGTSKGAHSGLWA